MIFPFSGKLSSGRSFSFPENIHLDDFSVFLKTLMWMMFQFPRCFSFPENIHRNGVGRVIEEETPCWPEGEKRFLIARALNSLSLREKRKKDVSDISMKPSGATEL